MKHMMMRNIPFMPEKAGENSQKSRFWALERCWNCPNAVIDLGDLEKTISGSMENLNFDTKRKGVLKIDKPMHHQVFRISVSGCPNSCSQPQIKDLGIQGQAVPKVGEGCTFCGECVQSCPDGAILLAEEGPEINRSACLNCGRCVKACHAGVITAPAKGYRVLVGGKLGRHPHLAETAIDFGDKKSVESVLKAVVDLLIVPEFAKERLGNIIEKRGMDWFKKNL